MENTLGVERLSDKEIYYFRQRNKNRIYQAIVAYFADRAEIVGLTKSEVARKLGKDPAQITRWFSGPGNWTLDTISDLLLAMESELTCEILPMRVRDEPINTPVSDSSVSKSSTRSYVIKSTFEMV